LRKALSIVLCILWMGFIFYNSSNNGEISNEKSFYLLNNIRQEYNKIKLGRKPIAQNSKSINQSVSKDKNTQKSAMNKILPKSNREEKLNLIIRKNAHTFEYLVVAMLVGILLFSFNIKGKSALVYIMFICLFYAVTDEFHQMFVPGRSSLVSDVLIDFLGSVIGIFIFYLFYYKIYKPKLK
jgi:VanZ family protein